MSNEDDFESIEATDAPSKVIQPINRETVHKICSGQVVVNLAVAAKELLENSIDASATLVEVKLKDQGLEQIEVIDNGTGVEEQNFVGLTAKYHTSKIREFCDLASVASFGFRGEALSSLCAVSNMVITTRHSSANYATKLVLDHNGVITSKSICPREIGTTVTISNLFTNLPVRKKEFQKNIKKEFSKLSQFLQSYCLVAKGVRIICSNQNKQGSRTTLMTTNGSQNVFDNIVSIFGTKQANSLKKLESHFSKKVEKKLELNDFDDVDTSFVLTQEEIDQLNLSRFEIEGWISNCAHGSGRSSRDRQFFYINNRPCEPKQVIKLVNEIYHRFNMHQSPFIFLNVILNRSDVDVNLTPDKRQILVNNEKILLLALKKCLLNTFGEVPSTFKLQNIEKFQIKREPLKNSSAIEDVNIDTDDENDLKLKPNAKKFSEMLSQWKLTGRADEGIKSKGNKRKPSTEIEVRTIKMKKIQEFLTQTPKDDSTLDDSSSNQNNVKNVSYKSESDSDEEFKSVPIKQSTIINEERIENSVNDCEVFILTPKSQDLVPKVEITECENSIDDEISKMENEIINNSVQASQKSIEIFSSDSEDINEHATVCKVVEPFSSDELVIEKIPTIIPNQIPQESPDSDVEYDSTEYIAKESRIYFEISIADIREKLQNEEIAANKYKSTTRLDRLKFKSEINPTQNKTAESELETEITKDMFMKMEIIGQFNLGFIIAKLENDLFIIDQHATDEKYNFETLQKTTKLQNQNLVVPQNLELTAVNEMILLDNLEVFKMNGFEFQIDENAPPTHKVKLLAKPQSQNWQFGKEDIDELIFMLQDAPPNTVCRPSRVRSMFASRACRKSVMIGQALSKRTMKQLIEHMGEIEHPWNCPHGRPTMRHLVNLALLQDTNENTNDDVE